MTKILFMEDKIENPGGGVEAMMTMEEKLSEDFETDILWVEYSNKEGTLRLISHKISDMVPLELGRLGYFLEPKLRNKTNKKISEFDPDIVFAQRRTGELALQYAEKNDTKVVLLLHDLELLYDPEFTHSGNTVISKILNSVLRPLNKFFASKVLERVERIVFNSKFTAKKYDIGHKADVIYPFINNEDYKVEETGDKILHVNPINIKGIDITLEAAEQMPDEEFMIVGSASNEIQKKFSKLDNVEYKGYLDDMKEAYRQSKIVLMPSTEKETFGRIPIEAGISGIPSVVSDKGGLPESVGHNDFTVSDYQTSSFIEKIRGIEADYEYYSNLAKENARNNSCNLYFLHFL